MTDRRRDLLLFLAAAVTMPFAAGRFGVAAMAWIAPALLLRFTRTQPLRIAIAGGIALFTIANFVWWRGVFPLTGIAYVIGSLILGTVTLLPWLVDRALAPHLGAFAGTLVLPSAAVSLELLQSAFSPYGSWGSWAYSQAGVLPVMQLASLTGLAGITFLVLWFAAVLQERKTLVAFACVFAAVMLFGFVRLRANGGDTVRIATLTPRIPTYTVRGDATNRAIHDALSSVRKRTTLTAAQWDAFRTRASAIDDALLAETAKQHARLVVWSEGAGIVETQDEAALIAKAAQTARTTGTWIELAYLVVDQRGSATFANRNVLVDDRGATVWTYDKSHPVPGMEMCVPGDGRVPVALTPFGRVATVICFDADFPRLVAQAGAQGADILLIPADDWREIAPMHAAMARFRAIEQGVSVVRATSNGISMAVDRYGRVTTNVPRAGAPTLYARTGDLAAWLAVTLLAALTALRVATTRTAPRTRLPITSY